MVYASFQLIIRALPRTLRPLLSYSVGDVGSQYPLDLKSHGSKFPGGPDFGL